MSAKTKKSRSVCNNSFGKTLTIRTIQQQICETASDCFSENLSSKTDKSSSKSSNCSGITWTIHRTPLGSEFPCENYCENVETSTMRTALESIAQEMQKFYATGTEYVDSNKDHENIFEKLSVIRSTLVKKNSLIRRLKSNLKMACSLAQSVWSSKDSESAQLSNRLQCARSEATMLLTVNRQRNSMMKQVECETKTLRERINNLHCFIQRAYEELQKIRGEPSEDIPVSMQLRQIIISCGQYYADYTNEHEKCVQLEQRNRFLANKINIMENNLATPRKVNPTRRQSTRCHEYKPPKTSSTSLCAPSKTTNCYISVANSANETEEGQLSTHFKLVRNILDDQNRMLKDLKDLALELDNESFMCL